MPVIVHGEAQAELDEAVRYYERQRSGLGLDLLTEIEQGFEAIRQNPRAWSRYKKTAFRYYVVPRFPYIIFYADLDEAIWIIAVAHGRRRPDYWRRRRIE